MACGITKSTSLIYFGSALIVCHLRSTYQQCYLLLQLYYVYHYTLCRYEALRITITQEMEQRNTFSQQSLQQPLQHQPQPLPPPPLPPILPSSQQLQPKASYNVQLVERCYPNYYQSATISEIDEPTESAPLPNTAAVAPISSSATVVATSVQHPHPHPHLHHHQPQLPLQHVQAVQASPVLVLHDDHQRHQLRQKALVDSVESKV